MLLASVIAIVVWANLSCYLAVRHAPDGYEDIEGFHYGLPQDPATIFT